MLFLTKLSMMILLITNVMMFLSMILSKKTYSDREKCSPFECGFNPKSSARMPFSLHFFLITVIFLIFDVEISLILPMVMNFFICNLITWTKITVFFLIILLLGVYHEWNQNMLNWTN